VLDLLELTLLDRGDVDALVKSSIRARRAARRLAIESSEWNVANATGRPVIGFMSGDRQHPDMMCEAVILAPTDLLDIEEIAASGPVPASG
jgi:hypothetical protein